MYLLASNDIVLGEPDSETLRIRKEEEAYREVIQGIEKDLRYALSQGVKSCMRGPCSSNVSLTIGQCVLTIAFKIMMAVLR